MRPTLTRGEITAHHRLSVELRDLLGRDRIPPCGLDPDAWFHPLQVVREMAARKCLSLCPLVEACARAGAAEEEGVWGGQDRTTATRRNHHRQTNHIEASEEEPCQTA